MPGSARIRRCSSTESFLPASSSTSLPPIPLPSSHRSVRSTGSAAASGKSPYWQAWSNINKLGSFMVRGSGSSNNNNTTRKDDVTTAATTTSKLTAARLAAHNRREQKYSSPYYKGLTDSSLIISRERGQEDVVVDADVEEDDLEIVVTSASQLPSFVSRMKEWRRRLSFSSKLDGIIDSNDTFSSALTTAVTPPPAVAEADAKQVDVEKEVDVETEEKPLRERNIEDGEDDRLVQSTRALTVVDVEKKGVELEFQWANKYRPKALKDFMCNRDKAVHLQSIIKEVNCNHFILQGPAGVGKTTMIWAMLQEAYGPDRVQTKEERMTFKLQGEPIGSIRVKVKASMQHVEVNVSAMKGYEKHIIVELIKKSHQRASSLSSDTSSPSKLDSCQAIVLHEAEKLSADGVVYIKWLLERYKGFSKFFFCCGDDASKLQPITPLCTVVQLSPPSHLEIVEVLEFIAKEEGIELPHELAARIAGNFKNNLRQAIRSFEACWRKSCQLTEDQVIWTGWEDDIANIAKNIIDEQSPKQLYVIRGKLQNLIEHDVSPDFIFMTLKDELKSRLAEPFQNLVDNLYKDYNRNHSSKLERVNQFALSWGHLEEIGCKGGHDPAKLNLHHFMRIEEFIAKFMSSYKSAMANGRIVAKGTSSASSALESGNFPVLKVQHHIKSPIES